MNFADLYRIASNLTGPNIPFKELRDAVILHHPSIGDVETWACDLDEEISLGHMLWERGRSSPYGDPYDVAAAAIRFSRPLNRCWQRQVCTKELMHVFDSSAAQTSDKGRFLKLMKELEILDSILPMDASMMLVSERWAEWMSLLALCPRRLRDELASQYEAGKNESALANRLKIPTIMIPVLMSDYYWRALETLTGDVRDAPVKKGHPS
jgi:hypothetical protein